MVAMNNGRNSTWEIDWYADTSATHDLKNDVANLNLKNDDNNGLDNVHVRNRQGLQISKTRTSQLSTRTSTFILNQVFLVREIQKNLIYVSQICIDNIIYFEF